MAKIRTTDINLPQIYAYSTPGVTYHDGWLKIGDTKNEFDKRIGMQTNTAGIIAEGHLLGFAIYEDGSNRIFRDHEFHEYLRLNGINDKHPDFPGDEWFEIDLKTLRKMFDEFRHNPSMKYRIGSIVLRNEQENAINKTVEYSKEKNDGEFLWNAKPRFGKTISAMEFCKRINADTVLVLTHRPAVANSWYEDFIEYLGNTEYIFVSETTDLKGKPDVYTREQYRKELMKRSVKCFEFVSLQDLKGAKIFGGSIDKLSELYNKEHPWDVVILDEAHEGVDTLKTEFALNKINRKFTLHLSGTPFKQIKNSKFDSDAIFNWTYVDEQKAKEEWSGKGENPYEELPKLNMFTYRMSNLVEETKKVNLDENELEYAYKLNKFFEVDKNNNFIHENAVDKFLNALMTDTKFPFSSKENREALAHSFWLLPSVASTKALEKKLRENELYKDYEIINVAGNIKKTDDLYKEYEEENAAYGVVRKAIKNHEKTITLSVKRLTTGVTIPEWTCVFILSEMKSAQDYMQAAFRAQNPCVFKIKNKYLRKTNSYVFDFNPERSLSIIEQFANDLYSTTAGGRGTEEEHRQNIEQLLKYFPVAGEDKNGNFKDLTADEVLSIPRAIRCEEVVKCGFMCNYLFSNDFSGIFRANNIVAKIINKMTISKTNRMVTIDDETKEKMHLNDDGEIEITKEEIEENVEVIVGDKEKIKEDVNKNITKLDIFKQVESPKENNEKLIKKQNDKIVSCIFEEVKNSSEKTNAKLSESSKRELEKYIKTETKNEFETLELEQNSTIAKIEEEINLDYAEFPENERKDLIESEIKNIKDKFSEKKREIVEEITNKAINECSNIVLKEQANKEKDEQEDIMREHLKGFARTIPSFLMAYGKETTTLKTFENDIPEDVFLEVTSITLDEFIYLRDGGDKEDEDGNIVHFDGNVFEETVFNDSVKEFLKKKKELSNYFDETSIEDIFTYIPPQKTNQIFTPKKVVKEMVDMLEQENPGCFDDPEKTFIDIYMKSGLYIAEIVKRLYRSEKMKSLYPDSKDRLKHIFKEQVFGLAPTEIIYKIAYNFILGFDEDNYIGDNHNLRHLDALPYAKDGNLEEKLKEIFDL